MTLIMEKKQPERRKIKCRKIKTLEYQDSASNKRNYSAFQKQISRKISDIRFGSEVY